MLNYTNVKRNEVAAIVNATFGDYRGRKIRVAPTETVHISDLNWSGGTRSQYRACTLDGRSLGGMDRYNAMAPWANPAEGASLPLVPGACVVEHSIFCGKDSGLRIYVHPDDMPRLISDQR
jgi:hypothetical protein